MRTGEDELIVRARSGDKDAFCELVKCYEGRIYALAYFYCREPHDAEDLSQEVWIKAFRSIGSFKEESTFYTWLRRITINTFLSDRRGRKARAAEKHHYLPGCSPDLPQDAAHWDYHSLHAAQESMINQVLLRTVMQALSQLTSHQRMIFLLKHQEGMTYAEIAVEMGCSIGTVKKALFRTISKLREHLYVKAESGDCASLIPRENLG